MNQLLDGILDAHGGMESWRGYEKVEATIISGGGFFNRLADLSRFQPCDRQGRVDPGATETWTSRISDRNPKVSLAAINYNCWKPCDDPGCGRRDRCILRTAGLDAAVS